MLGYKHLGFSKDSAFLVTGGAGFIGSNLCEAILNMGCKVRCLDNFSTGLKKNVDLFKYNSRYTFIAGDVKDFKVCLEATKNMDFVLHQAAWGSVPRSIDLPLFYESNNVAGTLNMMEASRINKVKKFVYASSSSVYGDSTVRPQKEGCEGRVISPYALTKRINEEYGRLYAKLYGLDTYGLRYFNVFGKRQNPNGDYAAVIPKFIKQLLKNEPPVIYGDGIQSRDFTYIENVVEANLKACMAPSDMAGQIFNIAYGGNEKIINVYYLIAEILNKNIKPIFRPERLGDIKHSNADISKAREILGYEPEWSFKKGINFAIEWYKDNI